MSRGGTDLIIGFGKNESSEKTKVFGNIERVEQHNRNLTSLRTFCFPNA